MIFSIFCSCRDQEWSCCLLIVRVHTADWRLWQSPESPFSVSAWFEIWKERQWMVPMYHAMSPGSVCTLFNSNEFMKMSVYVEKYTSDTSWTSAKESHISELSDCLVHFKMWIVNKINQYVWFGLWTYQHTLIKTSWLFDFTTLDFYCTLCVIWYMFTVISVIMYLCGFLYHDETKLKHFLSLNIWKMLNMRW